MHGVSTRKVDDLVKALGAAQGSPSRRCPGSAPSSTRSSKRSALALGHGAFPYVFADATYVKARVRGRVVSRAVVVATGVTAMGTGRCSASTSVTARTAPFGPRSSRVLKARGLAGVQLVISDHHLGLKAAIAAVFIGASWQRCRVHFMRNVLAHVPKGSAEMVAAAIRTMFAQPDAAHVRSQLTEIVGMLAAQFPDVAAMLADAGEDLLAFSGFPQAHWRKIWSTNPLERLNAEIKRRTNVVGIFPNDAAVLRLITAVIVETHDEWHVAERRYLSEESMAQIRHPDVSILAVEAPKARRRTA